MSRSSSPAVLWDHLTTWLEALTATSQGNLGQLSQEQLDTELDQLMTHDPTQSCSNKEVAKILGSLAHVLIAQARLSEGSYANLEQDAATLKLQAEEAWRDQALALLRLDQLLDTEKEDETDKEQRKEVERLQKTLEELRRDADRRVQSEKDARKDLDEQLRHGESLLERANDELKDGDARAKAYAKHLQSAQAEIDELIQQRHELEDELDMVQRELRQSYKVQHYRKGETRNTNSPLFKRSPASLHESPSAAEERTPFQEVKVNSHEASKNLDKLQHTLITANNKPVKHQHLFQECDNITSTLTLGIAFLLYRKFNKMRTSTAKLTTAVSGGLRWKPRREITTPGAETDFIELAPQP
ncbi:tropomyosin-2-like [Pseudorasbora parva]|uniref:tropomyosin-2-like n=1 Tax=Pseudorasbora parva TaxID=51549 RepID=UPI00351F4A92